MSSNFPPLSWENEILVVKTKWKRRREKKESVNCSVFDNNKIVNDGVCETCNRPHNDTFFGRYKNTVATRRMESSTFFIVMVVVIFNLVNLSFQRPVNNQVEEGSLTSAMVRDGSK